MKICKGERMKYGIYNWLKIRYYESAIQDINVAIKMNKAMKTKKILRFIKNNYKERIKFYKELDKLEKS